jgi:hypothetical protein
VTEDRLELLEQELELIKQRNARVEADKAWELSRARIGSICLITYVVASVLLYVIGTERFWLGALVPTLGFFLSAQSLAVVKGWWINSQYRRKAAAHSSSSSACARVDSDSLM